MADKKDKNLKENERYCFKCKKVVNKRDFNNYYKICHDCVENSSAH